MALILRIIRKSRWYSKPDWLSEGDLQADALGDLITKNNELSVWHINDDRSNLDPIIAALASKRDVLSNFDFALFDKNILEQNRLKFKKTSGISLDAEANELWHLDLYELSASKVIKLAIAIANNSELKRVSEREIKNILANSMASGAIKYDHLSQNLKLNLQ